MRLFSMCIAAGLALQVMAGISGWRMDGSGANPKATPPVKWGLTDNLAWATALPDWSNASPVLSGNRLFVCAEPDTLLCLDLNGKILWQHSNACEDLLTPAEKIQLADERAKMAPLTQQENEANRTRGEKQKELTQANADLTAAPDNADLKTKVETLKADMATLRSQIADVRKQKALLTLCNKCRLPATHASNGYTSNTPASDGKNVWIAFGNGVVACYTLDGTRVWARMLEKTSNGWGHSCSPLLVGDTLIIQYVTAFGLDANTGVERWHRSLGKNWGTPQAVSIGTLNVVVTDIGGVLNVADGKILGNTGLSMEFGSYLASGDTVYGASGATAAAFKLSLGADGALVITKLWQVAVSNDRYYASPLFADGLLYLVNAGGHLSVLDAVTGMVKYEQALKIGGCCYPSPTLCGTTIVQGSESGRVVMFAAGAVYQELARTSVDSFRSCPLADGRRLYIRSSCEKSKLYCFEAPLVAEVAK